MFEIISYGGGAFIADVLNGVAMFFGSSDYVHALKMCAMLASVSILVQSAFSGRLPDMKWIIMMVSIYMFVMVPKVDVVVTDTVKKSPGFPMAVPSQQVVGNVPIGLAFVASFTSGFKDYMVRGFETVFSLPNEVRYRSGGPMFAQGLTEEALNAKPKDPNLNLSLQNFWRNCVFYDLALGFYSMTDVADAQNLREFLAARTAAGRGYQHIYKDGTTTILMCKASISSGGSLAMDIEADSTAVQGDITWMNSWLSFAKSATGGSAPSTVGILSSGAATMPVAFQYLTGLSMSSSQILSQSVLANSFMTHGITAFSSAGDAEDMMRDYAATKAEAERNISFNVMGKIAGKMLPLLNIIAEGTIYAVFPIIGLMLMFPAAGKVAMAYLTALLWIALWAPLYALFHYFSMYFTHAAGGSAAQVCDIASTCTAQLNLYTMSGMKDAMRNAAAISGYLGTMVPMIAYMVVSRSGAMMASSVGRVLDGYQQPVSSAAGEAAAGNITMGQMGYQNLSAFQQNTAPSQTGGFSSNNNGSFQVTEGANGVTMKQNQSDLAISPSMGNAASAAAKQSVEQATQRQASAEQSLGEANVAQLQNTLSYAKSGTKSVSGGSGVSSSESWATEQTTTALNSALTDWGRKNSLTENQIASVSAGLRAMGAGVGIDKSYNDTETKELAERFSQSEQFSAATRNIEQATREKFGREQWSADNKSEDAMSASKSNQVKAEEAYKVSVQETEAAKKSQEYVEQNKAEIATNLSGALVQGLRQTGMGQKAIEKGLDDVSRLRNDTPEAQAVLAVAQDLMENIKPTKGFDAETEANRIRAAGASEQADLASRGNTEVNTANAEDRAEVPKPGYRAEAVGALGAADGAAGDFNEKRFNAQVQQDRITDTTMNGAAGTNAGLITGIGAGPVARNTIEPERLVEPRSLNQQQPDSADGLRRDDIPEPTRPVISYRPDSDVPIATYPVDNGGSGNDKK